MQRGLFFTTMMNHRPVIVPAAPAPESEKNSSTHEEEKKFHLTGARDKRAASHTLRDTLARSTQPIFSVSAMFGVRSGGGCGACGH